MIAGAAFAHRVPDSTLKLIFGAGLLVLAGFLILLPAPEEAEPGSGAGSSPPREAGPGDMVVIKALDGSIYEHPTCRRLPGVLLAGLGGGLTGLISAGLPEISTTQLILRCRIPPRVAIATSVFTLAVTVVVGAAIHALAAQPAWTTVAWSIPGVLIGSATGSQVGRYVPSAALEKILGVLFAGVASLVLLLELLG